MQIVTELLCKMLWTQLQSIGFFSEENGLFDPLSTSKLLGLYQRWFDETLEILLRAGYLKKEGASYHILDTKPFEKRAVWNDWDKEKVQWSKDPHLKAMIALLDIAMRSLPEILVGQTSATDILFPKSSMELVEGVYRNNATADYFNHLLGNTLVSFLEERLKQDPQCQIKILEIGAGTGGTTAVILEKLRPYQKHIAEYCYTDVSKAFLLHAEKQYGKENTYLTYQLFDVEKPLAEQEIKAGAYDVAIAANVLHATKSIRRSLRNAKAVLKKHGLLFLNEINSNNLFSHLTFGLLEGWWRYEDGELRIPGCPGLYPETWRTVLESEGFLHSIFVKQKIDKTGQQVIVAESDGIVRQQKTITPPVNVKKVTSSVAIPEKQTPKVSQDKIGLEPILSFIKQALAKTIKIAAEKIEIFTPFEKYGIDSILQVSFFQELEKVTGELPKTILFEHNTVQELGEYLLSQGKAIKSSNIGSALPLTRPPLKRFIQNQTPVEYTREDIAIIGLSGKYPLSNDLEELWNHLKEGKNCLTEAPISRHSIALLDHFSSPRKEPSLTKIYGGFLEEIDRFDRALFGMSHEQVMELSPEVRLFLEIVWETLENGGYNKQRINALQDREETGVGVFVGNMYNQYFWSIPSLEEALLSSNGTDWHLANRISHFFNLLGPSIAINTACSSSLYAIHLACESLRLKNCSMAIAGGVNLTLNLSKYDLLERARFLERGNESRSFGIADGLIPAEGVGAVLLKPLHLAIQDRDYVHAVIKGSFVNHCGDRQMYTAPDPKQQTKLLLQSMKKAQIDPKTIGYIESAANGSSLGDSIEIAALNKAFLKDDSGKPFCALGSLKSNLGHLEAASGIAALHKVILQLTHQTLVPTLHANPINPNIKLDQSPFYLQKESQIWEQKIDPQTGKQQPRRSMINSFGAGGSYANLIVEEYNRKASLKNTASKKLLFIFSAKTEWSLLMYLKKFESYLKNHAAVALKDIAWSLEKINHGLENRLAIIASSHEELLIRLNFFQKTQTSCSDLDIYFSQDSSFTGKDKNGIGDAAINWVAQISTQWSQIFDDPDCAWVPLPTYAFDHREEFSFVKKNATVDFPSIPSEFYIYDEPYLKGHQLNGEEMLIGATHASLALKAFFKLYPEETAAHIRKLTYMEPVKVVPDQKLEIKVLLLKQNDFQVVYRFKAEASWNIAAVGQFKKTILTSKKLEIESLKTLLQRSFEVDLIYTAGEGIQWGEIFKTLDELYLGESQVLAKIACITEQRDYELNPLITNSVYLAVLYLIRKLKIVDHYFPFGIQEIHFKKGSTVGTYWLDARLVKNTGELILFDVDILHDNEIFLSFKGFSLKQVPSMQTIKESDLIGRIQAYLYHKIKRDPCYFSQDSNLMDLGFVSSELLILTQEIEKEINIELNSTLFFEYPSIKELAHFLGEEYQIQFLKHFENSKQKYSTSPLNLAQLQDRNIINHLPLEKRDKSNGSSIVARELIHLNAEDKGESVFWFHGGFGGIESYEKIAALCNCPFYGIQASPQSSNVNGIIEMAAYYIRVLQSKQSNGPYNLGGFSLGGLIAYEITRQLQELGESISSIVMLDTFDHTQLEAEKHSIKALMFQTINMVLLTKVQQMIPLQSILIHQDEVDLSLEDELFWKELYALAKSRGLTRSEGQIRVQIEQQNKLLKAYQLRNYKILPLRDPENVKCYYFRNRSGKFFGDLKPYFNLDQRSLDGTTYWEKWKQEISQFYLIDVPCSSHLTMLSDQISIQCIGDLCRQLYKGKKYDLEIDSSQTAQKNLPRSSLIIYI